MSSSGPGASSSAVSTLTEKKPPDSSSSSSSIGTNSDDDPSAAGGSGDDQVADTGLSLNALEDALPIRKGLSEHHGGKSKSYKNLSDAAADSSIVKPEDPYSKKRKSEIATEMHLKGMVHGPATKKPTIDSRSTAPLSTSVGSVTSSQDDKSPKSSSDSDEKTA